VHLVEEMPYQVLVVVLLVLCMCLRCCRAQQLPTREDHMTATVAAPGCCCRQLLQVHLPHLQVAAAAVAPALLFLQLHHCLQLHRLSEQH
jgi:hypothetical protein